MDNIKIDRINTLAHKAKSVGLTEEEKKERDALRKEYIATIRMNLRSQLDNISIKEEDGSITNLGEKYGSKKKPLENRFLQREKRVLIKKYRNGAKRSQKISLLLRNIRQRTESLFMQITIMK
mgnify:CR=1 FL=1